MTMIENVARAIARSIDIDPDDGRADDAMNTWIRITAKAAIEAMCEPSEEMIDVCIKENVNCDIYHKMIDAALKED